MASLSGMLSKSNAPHESTIKCSSNGIEGNSIGIDPAAKIIFLASIITVSFLSFVNSTFLSPRNFPCPANASILFALNSPEIPLVRSLIMLFLRFCMAVILIDGLVIFIPCL